MKHHYGELPKVIDSIEVNVKEMMFYQDMLIKHQRSTKFLIEKRLDIFLPIIDSAVSDFIYNYGMERYLNSYVYLSAKHLFQPKQEPFNRPGWHTDGFMSDDITYVWSNKNPTVFNHSQFTLTQDHALSIKEMEGQAKPEKNLTYLENTVLRLTQYNVHKVAEVEHSGMRAFVKVSISKDKFDLIGNTHNYELSYDWEMKPRNIERNVPQSNVSK